MASDKDIHLIMSLTGVTEEVASAAYLRHETVEDAVDALLVKPETPGDKYIPAKPKIDSGLTPEQEALCKKGRWLQDQVNVVFSVAHSKTRTPQDGSVPEASAEPHPVSIPTLSDQTTSAPAQ
jgi:hypothetical protein